MARRASFSIWLEHRTRRDRCMTSQSAEPAILRAMLGKADEKLSAARAANWDGFFGEAASCSYYAAFHAASAVLAQKGLAFSSHAQVMGAFNREFVKTAILPADTTRRIQRLFEDRQTADYDWKIRVDEARIVSSGSTPCARSSPTASRSGPSSRFDPRHTSYRGKRADGRDAVGSGLLGLEIGVK